MVKIDLVVLSLALVLLIQFMEGQGARVAPPIKEKVWFINTLKAAIQDLAKEGIINPNALKSNVQEADFDEAYDFAKTTHQVVTAKRNDSTSTDAELSLNDEKNVFYTSLAYLLEKWGSKGLIDHSFMQQTLLTQPGIALQTKLDSKLTKMFQEARTNEGNVDSVKAKHDL